METWTKAASWMGKGLMAAGVGALGVMYLRGIFRERQHYALEHLPPVDDPRFLLAMAGLSNSMGTLGEVTGFYEEAEAIYAARLEAIAEAKHAIHFETFFWTPGRRADEFAAALCAKAASGVEVLVNADTLGAEAMPESYWEQLREAGVQVHMFRPFSWRAPLDYASRTHRKLLVVDGRVALIGGAGVSDWWDGNPEFKDEMPWRDLEIRLEGPVTGVLQGSFLQNWTCQGGTVDLREGRLFELEDYAELRQAAPVGTRPERDRHPDMRTVLVTVGTFSIENSAPAMLYQTSIQAARSRMWIASPYFVPDEGTCARMVDAAERGVDVRVLTMGHHNDRPYVRHAATEIFGQLLEAGVRIYEYQPSMMHAKLILVDDAWVSVGSANFDHLSFFNNDELNISTSSPRLVEDVSNFFETSFTRSHEVDWEAWSRRPLGERIKGQLFLYGRRVF